MDGRTDEVWRSRRGSPRAGYSAEVLNSRTKSARLSIRGDPQVWVTRQTKIVRNKRSDSRPACFALLKALAQILVE